jgi:propanediol dehydratase small subunit
MQTAASRHADHVERPALLGVPRGVRIVSKTIYKELRAGGLSEDEVLAIATELLGLVTAEIRDQAD